MFVDEVKVYARAGHGGAGCVAFLREAFRPKGGPSGGNGGRGGSVILEANHDLNNLIAQFYAPRLIAQKGSPGMGKGRDGLQGKDLVIKVPCGTLIWRLPNPTEGEQESRPPQSNLVPPPDRFSTSREPGFRFRRTGPNRAVEIDMSGDQKENHLPSPLLTSECEQVADLTVHEQQFVLCQGGRGGLGNRAFATARRQTPRFAQPGEPGEEGQFVFELRFLAEVGLVGYPNAGKSTLLTAISRARPRIAAYPFTTLHPQIGMVEYADFRKLTVCDVPGIIEGAHQNVGLGYAFLRHIERCRLLVIVLDMAGTEGRAPWDDYTKVLEELRRYDPELLERNRLVAGNKMDEPAASANLKLFKRRMPSIAVLPMSAGLSEGMDRFKDALCQALEGRETRSQRTVAPVYPHT